MRAVPDEIRKLGQNHVAWVTAVWFKYYYKDI